MKKITQKFNEEHWLLTKDITPTQACQFLEDFRKLYESQLLENDSSQLISIKIPKRLLKYFKDKCSAEDVKYQTQIKNLMMNWLGVST